MSDQIERHTDQPINGAQCKTCNFRNVPLYYCMLIVSLSLMFFSHLLFQIPFWSALSKQRLPNTLGFASLGLFLYYDLGIIAEMTGLPYSNTWYRAVLSPFDNISVITIAILTFAPWLFMLGWISANSFFSKKYRYIVPITEISYRRILFFVCFATIVSLICVATSLYFLKGSASVWSSRANIGESLGPFVILLNIPLALLAFWLMQRQSKTNLGKLHTVFLVLSSITSTLPIGQRTIVLLPVLMVVIFGFKISIPKFIFAGAGLIIVASLILPIFKWQYSPKSSSENLITQTIYSDLHRANVLASNIEQLTKTNVNIMPYIGAGYVYTAMALIPRAIVPWKGYSSSTTYTAWREGRNVEDQDWALAITSIDELLLNFGFSGIIGLIFFGALARFVDHFSNKHISFIIPVRLAIIWAWGYDSSVLILLYGNMILISLLLHWIFVQKASLVRKNYGSLVLNWRNR